MPFTVLFSNINLFLRKSKFTLTLQNRSTTHSIQIVNQSHVLFTVRWVCAQRLLKEAHTMPDESPRLQIDLLLVTLVEGVIAKGKNAPSFQVQFSLDNVTWVNATHHGALERQVKGCVIAQRLRTLRKMVLQTNILILVDLFLNWF